MMIVFINNVLGFYFNAVLFCFSEKTEKTESKYVNAAVARYVSLSLVDTVLKQRTVLSRKYSLSVWVQTQVCLGRETLVSRTTTTSVSVQNCSTKSSLTKVQPWFTCLHVEIKDGV